VVGAGTNQLYKYSYRNNIQLMKWQECFVEGSYISLVGDIIF